MSVPGVILYNFSLHLQNFGTCLLHIYYIIYTVTEILFIKVVALIPFYQTFHLSDTGKFMCLCFIKSYILHAHVGVKDELKKA